MTRRKKRFLYGLLALVVCGFLVAQGLRLVMCSRICNYAFQVNGMAYRAKPVVGYVSLYGINLCRLLRYCPKKCVCIRGIKKGTYHP